MSIRRGSRPVSNMPKTLRLSPKNANGLTDYRRASLEEDINKGIIREGINYNNSNLNKNIRTPETGNSNFINRGDWQVSSLDDGARIIGNTKLSVAAVAHSESYLQKKAGAAFSSTSSGSGTSSGASVERLAPEVYSPLFTMANLNLPRDRITVNAWIRNFFELHPIVRNAITLHATYPISKINIKCHDKRVLRFFEDMVEEMNLMQSLGEVALEYWKLGEKIQGSSLITMSDGTLKQIKDIKIGEYVLTHLGNKKKVVNIFKKPTSKVIEEHLKIYKIKTVGIPNSLIISGKHPILASKFEEVLCDNPKCKIRKVRVLPRHLKCSNCGKINKKEFSPEFIKMKNIEKNDIVYAPFNNDVVENENFNEKLCYLMGYWLAEGCYCKAKRKNYTKYNGIKFCSYDGNYIKEELVPLLEECTGYSGNTYMSKSSHFVIGKDKFDHWLEGDLRNGPQWAKFFQKHCGEYSKEKQLSEDIMLLPPKLQLQLLAGFIDGDGCVDNSNGHIIICSSSKSLINQFVLILRRLGVHPTFSKVEKDIEKNIADKYRIKIVANEAYNLFKNILKTEKKDKLKEMKWCSPNSSLYNNWQMLNIKEMEDITEEFNENFMYDLEVEEDHSYVANGIAIHNCFPFAELDEGSGKWAKIIVQNPDYILVKKSVFAGDSVISLKPDQVLQRLAMSNNPADVQLRKQIPEKILHHIRKGEAIPLDNFNISHLKMVTSPYDVRGTSIVVGVFKDLMLYDKLRECYSIDTEILTNEGFKFYNEITEKDKIATFNKDTEELEYQNYTNRIQYHYEGDMYHFTGKRLDVLVTPNHRMWLSKFNSKRGYENFDFINAKDVKNTLKYKSRSVVKWKGKKINFINIFNKKVPIKDYLRFLGYLISEGSVRHCEEKASYCTAFSQSESSPDFEKMENSFCKMGEYLDFHVSTAKTLQKSGFVKAWRFYGKEISKYFKKEIGSGAHNKKVPKWVKRLSSDLLEIILEALVEGDGRILTGHLRGNTKAYSYSTVSKQLADDVQEMAFKCGYAPRLDIKYNGQGTKFYSITWSLDTNVGKFPTIYGNNKKLGRRGGYIEKLQYNNDVFCFEVPNGLFITRRNGLINIQGNCKFAQADSMINPITVIKVGGNTDGDYRATAEDIEYYRQILEEAQYDKDFKLITHAGISIEKVGSNGQIIDIGPDMDMIVKNIYTGLMVPQAIVDTESAVYSSASIGLEVLRQRYFNFRNMIAQWLTNKIFAPISEIQNFYEYDGGVKRLIVPEIEWNQMNLYDLQDYIGNISGLVGNKQVSLQTLYKSLGLNYQDEIVKMRQEMINDAIRMKEEQSLQKMTISELRVLDPEKEVMEPIDNKEREAGGGTPPEAGGFEMGGMPGGELGGMPGGLGELAPPPGGEMGIGGAPGGPGGAGSTPELGPGASPTGSPGV